VDVGAAQHQQPPAVAHDDRIESTAGLRHLHDRGACRTAPNCIDRFAPNAATPPRRGNDELPERVYGRSVVRTPPDSPPLSNVVGAGRWLRSLPAASKLEVDEPERLSPTGNRPERLGLLANSRLLSRPGRAPASIEDSDHPPCIGLGDAQTPHAVLQGAPTRCQRLSINCYG
jgi:hypothetical protein